MTFRDNYTQFWLVLLLSTGCWAPEVEPTTPKKSPAEIAGLAIASAEASAPTQPTPSPQDLYAQEMTQKRTSTTPTDATVVEELEKLEVYPFQATLSGENASLLGHGGGIILTLELDVMKQAQIEVLERKEDFYRVICQNCTETHPFQAGWIQHSELTRLD